MLLLLFSHGQRAARGLQRVERWPVAREASALHHGEGRESPRDDTVLFRLALLPASQADKPSPQSRID